jgi:PKD repeat protein
VVNHKPKTGFMVPEVCINDVATVFTDTSTIAVGGLDPTGYYWDFGDPASGVANFSTVKNGSHLYTAIGPYNVMHVSTSLAGCKDTVYHTIFINAADPVADFNIPFPTTMCANDSVSIINRSTISQGSVTKLEIYWDVVGAPGVFETIDDPVFNAIHKHKYPTQAVTQTYTIRMVAYSGAICFSNKVVNITVNAAPSYSVPYNA